MHDAGNAPVYGGEGPDGGRGAPVDAGGSQTCAGTPGRRLWAARQTRQMEDSYDDWLVVRGSQRGRSDFAARGAG